MVQFITWLVSTYPDILFTKGLYSPKKFPCVMVPMDKFDDDTMDAIEAKARELGFHVLGFNGNLAVVEDNK